MNSVEQPIRRDLSGRVSGFDERPSGERKWPVHYDSVELLAMVADVATIVFISLICGLCYQLQASGTPAAEIGKSFGSAILVSALFISVMKIRGMYRPTE